MSDSESKTHPLKTASQRIPPLARPHVSERALKTLDIVEKFVEEECMPADAVYFTQIGDSVVQRFDAHPPIVEELKEKAKKLGLWNMFLPRNHYFKEGAGYSNLEYGLMAEMLGKSRTASEATNCAAPDTGNMEVLAQYGTEAQKRRWLDPLLEGKIRSAFLMTEPDIASSDATNIQMKIEKDGDHWVLNGSKWWSSGAGDRRCQLYIVVGKTDPGEDIYNQQSVIFVPANTPGITVHRMLSVFGYDDAPHGHGHITFENVRVPLDHIVLGRGRGFEIMQGRLGPGRIHHAMRSIGAAERAFDLFLARINDPRKISFGQKLSHHGTMLERVAKSRIEIDAARLVVLNAAIAIDNANASKARKEIAMAKVLAPQALLNTVDWAIQAYGAAGVSQDTPLAQMYATGRTMRIVDGPDEVHMLQLARNENRKAGAIVEKMERMQQKVAQLMRERNIQEKDILFLGRTTASSKL